MERDLGPFGSKVDALIKGQSLSRDEANWAFRQILQNEQPDLQQGAFLAAITAKGATPEEIAGIWEAIYELDTIKAKPEVNGPLVENCGTGMDTLKTFNISTAAAIVAASDGVHMAKHGARAITSKCGAVDMAEALGIDVECDASLVRKSIEETGIGLFNGMSGKVHPQALYRILSQVRFGTVLNIAGSLANPAMPNHAVRGVFSQEMVRPIAESMREMGYFRALVVHGLDAAGRRGMDEISTLGKTFVAELKGDGTIEEYTISPEDLGCHPGHEKSILCRPERDEEVVLMLRLLCGLDDGPRKDIVSQNAGAVLYVTGHSSDLEEGCERAKALLESGKPAEKLKDWARSQGSEERAQRLEEMVEAACSEA